MIKQYYTVRPRGLVHFFSLLYNHGQDFFDVQYVEKVCKQGQTVLRSEEISKEGNRKTK